MNICFLFSLDSGTCWVHLLMWRIEFCNKTAWFKKNRNKETYFCYKFLWLDFCGKNNALWASQPNSFSSWTHRGPLNPVSFAVKWSCCCILVGYSPADPIKTSCVIKLLHPLTAWMVGTPWTWRGQKHKMEEAWIPVSLVKANSYDLPSLAIIVRHKLTMISHRDLNIAY